MIAALFLSRYIPPTQAPSAQKVRFAIDWRGVLCSFVSPLSGE
jgi:hypothetical protein